MLAVIAAILFSVAEVLHLLHIQEFTVETCWLGGLIALALAACCGPGLPKRGR